MDNEVSQYIASLDHADPEIRLDGLRHLMAQIQSGAIERPARGNDVNNHIHTTYSFSPYSPTKAVWMAYQAGLATAGIMDHDSIGGAREFTAAGRIAGLATTIGIECRVDFSKTPLGGRRINNPDQDSVAYVALHGIPHTQIDKVRDFFKPYSACRNQRNRQMVAAINRLIAASGVALDFEKDVMPLSQFASGGSITERHLLYALSLKLIGLYGKGAPLLQFLTNRLGLNVSAKIGAYLADAANPHVAYDLLGLLKGELVGNFYIKATDECPDVREVVGFAREIGAISAYAYLGDVGDSVTGDKKAQKFEDDYLDLLFEVLKELRFNAVTYMPSRNTPDQLEKVRFLCDRHGFFQISGEDINSPRQSFICQAMRHEKFNNLYEATWALVGHEIAATANLEQGMFSAAVVRKYPELAERIKVYREIGLQYQREA